LAVALAIFAPHRVYYSRESVIELQTKTAEEVTRALKGEPPRSPVNPEVLGSRELLTLAPLVHVLFLFVDSQSATVLEN